MLCKSQYDFYQAIFVFLKSINSQNLAKENLLPKEPVKILFVDWYKQYDPALAERELEWRIISKKYDLELSEDPEIIFYSNYGEKHKQYTCLRVFVSMENVRPNFHICDYAFTYDYPITARNYRLPLYRRCREYKDLLFSRDVRKISAEKRKFCGFVVSNQKAKERIEFFNKLSSYKPVDSGGRYMNNIGVSIEPGRQNKEAWLRNYKFNIAFENTSYPGYTTEKILEAFISGTIPIYWGNPLISLDFNPKAFINCNDFKSFDEVIEYVIEVDQNEALYIEYLSQPIFSEGVEPDFCREENIFARYDEIFSTRKVYLSKSQKRMQQVLYPANKLIKRSAKRISKQAKGYVNAAKQRVLKLIK